MACSRAITIINVPSDVGSMIKGKSLTPEAFQSANFASKLQQAGFDVDQKNALERPSVWSLDASFNPNGVRNEEANIAVNHQVKKAVSKSLDSNASTSPVLVIIGASATLLPLSYLALWESLAPKRVGLLYVDGDAELAIPGELGSSGNLASMTFTHLTMIPGALESMKPFTRPDGKGVVDSSNAVIFGINIELQGNTRGQIGHLTDEGYRVFTLSAVAKDPELRAEQALQHLETRVDDILVHLDVDAIDATEFPLANIPNRTGAAFDKVMAAMKIFLRSEKVCGLVIAEVNPDHDPGLKKTNRLIDSLIDGLRGRT